MAPKTSSAERYIIEDPATPEEAQRLFGISDKRVATLAKWADEALRAVESSPRKPPVKAAKRGSKRAVSKRTAKKRKPSAKG